MKASPGFKTIINNHLQALAVIDPLFAETYKKPAKNLDDCINYILGEVQKSGIMGYADEEIFGMAVHYYDEDDIKPGKAINAKIVINHHVDAPVKLPATATKEEVTSLPQPKAKKKADNKPTTQQFLFS